MESLDIGFKKLRFKVVQTEDLSLILLSHLYLCAAQTKKKFSLLSR